jgi:hypothetical protein
MPTDKQLTRQIIPYESDMIDVIRLSPASIAKWVLVQKERE